MATLLKASCRVRVRGVGVRFRGFGVRVRGVGVRMTILVG